MKRLIVNADGFGFTFGNNRAILEVLEHGFVRSVSVNVTWPAVKEVSVLVRQFPHVSVGIHLNLSVGPPILPAKEIPSLVGANGEFLGAPEFRRRSLRRQFDVGEMKRELRSQIARLRYLGVRVSHWDSHQGQHLYPGFFEAVLAVARAEGILASRTHRYYLIVPPGPRLRGVAVFYLRNPRQVVTHALAAQRMRTVRRAGIRLPDHRLVLAPLGPAAVYQPEAWNLLLSQAPEGLNFVECHPGYVDDDLRKFSTLLESRERERELFSDPLWGKRAAAAGVEVVSYHALLGTPD